MIVLTAACGDDDAGSTTEAPGGPPEVIADGLDFPFGLAFDPDGGLLVSLEKEPGSVLRLDLEGDSHEVVADGLLGPSGLAFDSSGLLYISDDTSSIVSPAVNGGVANMGFPLPPDNPNAIAFDADDNLYVLLTGASESSTGSLIVFGLDGSPIAAPLVDGLVTPQGLAFDVGSNTMYLSDGLGTVYAVDTAALTVETLAQPSQESSGGLAVDGDGNVLMASALDGAVYRIEAGTREITACLTGLDGPRGLVIDDAGNIYVSQSFDNPGAGSVLRFSGCE